MTKWLSFRPQAGIRFAEIKQKYKAEYLSLFTDGVVSSFEETSFEALNKFDGLIMSRKLCKFAWFTPSFF